MPRMWRFIPNFSYCFPTFILVFNIFFNIWSSSLFLRFHIAVLDSMTLPPCLMNHDVCQVVGRAGESERATRRPRVLQQPRRQSRRGPQVSVIHPHTEQGDGRLIRWPEDLQGLSTQVGPGWLKSLLHPHTEQGDGWLIRWPEDLQGLSTQVGPAWVKSLSYTPILSKVMGGSFVDQKICKDSPHR